jgi:outer membrane protein
MAATASWQAARAESLADAIALAYQSNPTLQNQRAQLRVTDETYVQARAGYRPTVNVQVQGTRQDYGGQTTNSGSTVVSATQPIYSGGRTAAAVSAAEADILAGRETLRATEAGVLQQVVQAYADVLRDQEGVSIREVNLAALTDQLKEATARAKVGDLTRTDVAQTQGYASQAKVDLASAKAQLQASKANYAAVIGQTPGVLEPLPALPNMPADVNQAFATAEAGNPQLRASQYAEQAARMRTAEARDQRLPTVSLRAQYGYNGPISPFSPNIYGLDAVASATITQPLFAGGVIDSQIRQQIERQASARIQTEQIRRQTIQQISQAWGALLAAHENVANAEEGVQANAVAYEGVQKERRADLRSTLEVLYIEQSLRQAELTRAAARHDAYVSGANLLQATGMLEAERLVPGINLYDPAKAFNKVRTAGSVPWEAIPAALDHLTAPALKRLPPPPSTPVTVPPN